MDEEHPPAKPSSPGKPIVPNRSTPGIQKPGIFEFEIQSVAPDRTITGALRSTGLRPVFLEKFRKRGIELPQSVFGERVASLDERRGATA